MRLTLKQIRRLFIILIICVISGIVGFYFGRGQVSLRSGQGGVSLNRKLPVGKERLEFGLFWKVWDRVSASFLDKEKVDPRTMIYGAISGMVASLGDPYTVFLPPNENQRSWEDLAGSFGGVGIQLGFIDHQLAVIAPLAETPAARAGVKAGDLILKVDGDEAADISLPEAVDRIRGRKGTAVVLTLFREGEEKPFDVSIVRDTILVKSVEVDFLDDWCSSSAGGRSCPLVAHLKLMRFGDRTNEEWGRVVGEIKKRCPQDKGQCRGVILDLRNNPGGYLSGSVFIVSEFLSSGVVVQEETVDGNRQAYDVGRRGSLLDVPLVVLVNKGSASASEIVAGALKENQRAQLVGEVTFGKGTIQEPEDLEGGAGLHITTARWLLPSGQSVDGQGLTPNFEVSYDDSYPKIDKPLEKAIEVLGL
jgi:carboxyl-terminal processing protease